MTNITNTATKEIKKTEDMARGVFYGSFKNIDDKRLEDELEIKISKWKKELKEYIENTHNGIYMDSNNWDLISQNGWNIEVAKNFGETIYGWSDEDPLCMDMNPIRIRADKSNQPIEFAMSRKEAKEEGDYKLECLSSCSVVDATLSVWSEGKCKSSASTCRGRRPRRPERYPSM